DRRREVPRDQHDDGERRGIARLENALDDEQRTAEVAGSREPVRRTAGIEQHERRCDEDRRQRRGGRENERSMASELEDSDAVRLEQGARVTARDRNEQQDARELDTLL